VRLVKLCRRDQGLRGVRFIHPRWTSLYAALARANADLYYYTLGDLALGQIALWTKTRGKKLIFSVACDTDCLANLPTLRSQRERILYRYGLKHCDAIIAQTKKQAELLWEQFALPSSILAMPSEGAAVLDRDRIQAQRAIRVLWIGRITPEKRPHWLLDIAERLPQLEFEIVGAANTETDYSRRVVERAKAIPNVTVSGRVPYSEMSAVYSRVTILCSTSEYEGFPNVFLEAWSAAIPVVTTFDPDGLIATRGLGVVGATVDELAAAIERLAESRALRAEIGVAAQSYFAARHTLDNAMAAFAQFFEQTCNGAPRDVGLAATQLRE